MNTFSKICLFLLAGFLLICVCSFAANGKRGSSNRPARWSYNLKQPKVDASEEWKKVAGKVWVCSSPFTVTGSGTIYYRRFFENQEGQYWSRVAYHIPPHSWREKIGPEIFVELEQIELDKHFIRRVNRSPRGITWGISGDTLIVPAVVKAEPKKWVYSRFTRENKHEEYFYEFENELKTGSSGKFKFTYEKKYGRGEPEVIEREDYTGQYTCAEIKGRTEIMVRFSDMRYVNKTAIPVSYDSRFWYVNLENGVGFFDKGPDPKASEKGWYLPKLNYPDWRIFHKETETNKPLLLKFLSDYEEKEAPKDSVGSKKKDEIGAVEANIKYALVNAIDEGDITEANIEEAKRLLTKGADINVLSKRDGCTSLHYAAIRGQKKLTEFLLANSADINAKDTSGANALQGVVFIGNVDMARFLIKNGIDINNQGGFRNRTALHIAARIAHRELVELLITDGANINVEDENGWTPLRHATQKYRNVNGVEIIKILIENGADVNAKNDKDSWTPLSWAAKEGDYDLVKLLIAKGADVNAKDDKEKTAFDYARKYRHKEITELLRKHTGEPRVGFP